MHVTFVGPREEAAMYMLDTHPEGHRPVFPLCFLPRWRSGEPFFVRTSLGVLQYAAIRTSLAVANLVLVALIPFAYGEGIWSDPTKIYVYFLIVVNFSQMWASEYIKQWH